MVKTKFRSDLGENVFRFKYAQGPDDTWDQCAERIVEDVCGTRWGTAQPLMSLDERKQLVQYIQRFAFLPGGRYIYYSGRPNSYFNNCYLLRAEHDTREEWADLAKRATSCLMTGGGIGVDYSILRAKGKPIRRTGGVSSGPLSLMSMINEIGRNVMQGGSRRSAIYASLNWLHEDAPLFLEAKNWSEKVRQLKAEDFNFPAQLDMTNISLNYDDAWLNNPDRAYNELFLQNCKQAMQTGEPGFSFNFGDKQNETLRNACTEVTSEDDSDVCNLGSINIGAVVSLDEFRDVVALASKFLVCGTMRASLPYDKVYEVRNKNRRLGLGLMGIHEWLLKKGYGYEVVPELHSWLRVYRDESERAGKEHCDRFYLSHPAAYRAIAPTGKLKLPLH
jgi:ribonucleoside-diphosphate reductase alpha chain